MHSTTQMMQITLNNLKMKMRTMTPIKTYPTTWRTIQKMQTTQMLRTTTTTIIMHLMTQMMQINLKNLKMNMRTMTPIKAYLTTWRTTDKSESDSEGEFHSYEFIDRFQAINKLTEEEEDEMNFHRFNLKMEALDLKKSK